mgnify:CR=1 FL=1
MIVLYQRTGTALQLESIAWSEALATAEKWGWRPSGTQAPAVDFDLGVASSAGTPWDHCYERPEGQTVCREDARSLARAINTACTQAVPFERAKFVDAWEIANFCALGSFLICADPAMTLPDNPIDSTESLLRLNSALEPAVFNPPATAPEASGPTRRTFDTATIRSAGG